MVLRQDLENTVYSELGGLRRAVGVYVRARSTTLYLLPVTGATQGGVLFISEIPCFSVVERQKYFRFSLP